MKQKLSKYQETIKEKFVKTDKNILINAKAGSGKTTTIKMLSALVTDSVLFVAFNKKIAEELKSKLPPHVECKTLHALGFGIIRQNTRVKLDNWKIPNILKDLANGVWYDEINDLFQEKKNFEKEKKEYLKRIDSLVSLAKMNLVDTDQMLREIAEKHDIITINGEVKKALIVLKKSEEEKYLINFDDMIYHAVKFYQPTNTFKTIFVDEAQDLNRCQQELFKKVLNGRFVAVGDPSHLWFLWRR